MKNEYPSVQYLANLARRAGVIMKGAFCLGMDRSTKTDGTPLTKADTEINRLVLNWIQHDYPYVRVIAEEGSREVDGAEYTVLCDPIDGTIPFSRGIPISAFAISVIKDHQPLAAVIYDPFMDRMWTAVRGEGTCLNGKRVKVSEQAVIRGSYTCMVWWNGSAYHLHDVCKQLMDAGGIWMNPASIAYFGGLLASGEIDATIFPGPNGWETAAMHLIAEEAGGKATNIYGQPLQYGPNGEVKGHVISNGLIHDDLVQLVQNVNCAHSLHEIMKESTIAD